MDRDRNYWDRSSWHSLCCSDIDCSHETVARRLYLSPCGSSLLFPRVVMMTSQRMHNAEPGQVPLQFQPSGSIRTLPTMGPLSGFYFHVQTGGTDPEPLLNHRSKHRPVEVRSGHNTTVQTHGFSSGCTLDRVTVHRDPPSFQTRSPCSRE